MTTPRDILNVLLESDELDSPGMTIPGYTDWFTAESEKARTTIAPIAERFFDWLDTGFIESIWAVKSLLGASNDYYVLGARQTDNIDYNQIDAERNLCIEDSNPACGAGLARALERLNIHFCNEPPPDGIKVYTEHER